VRQAVLPVLLEVFSRSGSIYIPVLLWVRTARALGRLGAEAAPALPILELLTGGKYEKLREAAGEAVERIGAAEKKK